MLDASSAIDVCNVVHMQNISAPAVAVWEMQSHTFAVH